MNKLLRRLFFWLFKEDFERMNKLESDLKRLTHRQKCATQEAEVHAERIRKLMGNIDISVNIHHRSNSWVVISLQSGQNDYIKFIDLRNQDVKEIAHFLRQYDREKHKSRCKPFERSIIANEIFKF